MVIVKHVLGACSFALLCVSLRAGELPVYKIGDKAAQDIVATVPFDLVDAQATAELKTSQAQDIAAIYHQFDGQTNVMARNYLAAFEQARQGFSNAVAAAYHQPSIDNSTIEASNFGYLVTEYNARHKAFPVTTELAVAWARGGSGAALRDKWFALLLQAMKDPVQPDAVPAHFVYKKKVRIMPVTSANQKFTFTQAWRTGHIISLDKISGISAARAKFRQQFSEGDQPLAGALAQFLQADCFPDVDITKQARDHSVRQIVASRHFDANQVILHRGETVNAQVLAALAAMHEATGPLAQQIADEHERAQQEHQLAQAEQQQAQIAQQAVLVAQQQQQQAQADRAKAQSQADEEREQALEAQQQAQKIRERDVWLLAALGVVFIVALFIVVRLTRRQYSSNAVVKFQAIEKLPAAPATELAPYLAQTLKEAVVQGLAAQRAELLDAQRLAAAEIAELVQRLDTLQAPMQERIRAYQERIQELQKELAERNQENRELLKMKIEMVRQQIEAERSRVRFN